MIKENSLEQSQLIKNYYNFQSAIYDTTRWSFLFGRKLILNKIDEAISPQTILEVGCGTGYNLKKISKRFPNSKIYGVDVSKDMLKIAKKKLKNRTNVELIESPYGGKSDIIEVDKPDVILFSYMLTMVNPGFSNMIIQAYKDLKPGGCIAVVDFYNSKHEWFRNHMGNHHVRMERQLKSVLEDKFEVINNDIHHAYKGVWEYFSFIGKKVN